MIGENNLGYWHFVEQILFFSKELDKIKQDVILIK